MKNIAVIVCFIFSFNPVFSQNNNEVFENFLTRNISALPQTNNSVYLYQNGKIEQLLELETLRTKFSNIKIRFSDSEILFTENVEKFIVVDKIKFKSKSGNYKVNYSIAKQDFSRSGFEIVLKYVYKGDLE